MRFVPAKSADYQPSELLVESPDDARDRVARAK